jgi:dATP pyrophosphohydrolase
MNAGDGAEGAATQGAPFPKIPESVLVVIYTRALDVLLLERADHAGFWQSVTGSRAAADEPLRATCAREVAEETGLVLPPDAFDDWCLTHRYEIYAHWRNRYAPGVTHNTEHVFGLCVPQRFEPVLAPAEHTRCRWLPWRDAADACFSWTNAEAIRRLESLGAAR